MKIRSQIGMVLNLDKCIGCHTCSITCKNVWTSREGMEYAWFNNVESKPGTGYPSNWEDQSQWKGGWERTADGDPWLHLFVQDDHPGHDGNERDHVSDGCCVGDGDMANQPVVQEERHERGCQGQIGNLGPGLTGTNSDRAIEDESGNRQQDRTHDELDA